MFYRPAQLAAKHSFVFLPCLKSSVEHVQADKLQAVPPVQQPDDLLIYTPVPQIKVHYNKLNYSCILIGSYLLSIEGQTYR